MTAFRRARTEATLRLVWKTLSGSHQERSGGGAILLPALLFVTPAMASTLHEGSYVREGRSCSAERDADRLVSNGHSVSPPGAQCRVVSRTSSGDYYPIFNQRCTSGADDYSMDVHVSTPDRISVRRMPAGRSVAYRHCPSRGSRAADT